MGREFEIKSVKYDEKTGVVDVYAVDTTGIESVTTEITITKTRNMAKRKLKDSYTGISDGKHPSDTMWNTGGSSRNTMSYYAVLNSDAYYETEDDNHANFSGWYETTPKFNTEEELRKYMSDNGIGIGSTIERTVPINDWEHKVYNRVVSLPVTDITVYAEYTSTYTSRSVIEYTDKSGTEKNPKQDNRPEPLKDILKKHQLQSMYFRSKIDKSVKDGTETLYVYPKEISSLFKMFGLSGKKQNKKK